MLKATFVAGIVPQQTVTNMIEWNMGRLSEPYINASDIDSFRRIIHMSMVVQADCLRAEAEHYRRGRDFAQRTGGSLFWMLDDNWPTPSWASVEYGGRRKLLHYEAARFYSTVAISSYCLPSIENCSVVDIHITSDLTERNDLMATLQVNLTRWRDGKSITVMSIPVMIPVQNGTTVQFNATSLSIALQTAGCASTSECFLTSRLLATGRGFNTTLLAPDKHQWLTLWKDAKLLNASFQIHTKVAKGSLDGSVEVTVSSDTVAPAVMVHCVSCI
jgi:beta-galactosidase/beta-glucuronidase